MNYRECARLLRQQDDLLIITHKNPDGDTMSSAAALCSALRRAGKTAWLYPNHDASRKLKACTERYFAPEDFVPAFRVSVDVATEELLAEGYDQPVDLCIDHHPTNTHFGKAELVKADRSSCGEIVLELIKSLCGDLSKEEATLLYIAVTTDTGCFQYANTGSQTLAAASELLRLGAEGFEVARSFFRKLSPARLKLEGMIYSNLRYFRNGQLVFALVTQDMLRSSGAGKDDFDDLAGLAGRAEGSLMNVTIRELENGDSKVSVRSNPGISSRDVCAVFGGGGHELAAGCTIHADPEKAQEMLLTVIDEVWK